MGTLLEQFKQTISQAKAGDIAAAQAAMPDEVRELVDAMKVGEYLSIELGRIEQASSLESLDIARGKACAYLSSALAYSDLRGIEDWKVLDLHLNKRATLRGTEIEVQR